MDISVHNLNRNLRVAKKDIIHLVQSIVQKIELELKSCQIIFVDDETLRTMHEDYLNDPDYTDVMTFNLGEDKIEGEIFISYDRIKENANIYEVSIENEIYRNIIHGLLHLKGYNDKVASETAEMKQKEEELLHDTLNPGIKYSG